MLSSPVGSSENPNHVYDKQEGSSCDKRKSFYTETVLSEPEHGNQAYRINHLGEIEAFLPSSPR